MEPNDFQIKTQMSEDLQQFNFTQKSVFAWVGLNWHQINNCFRYNEMCRNRLVTFFKEWNRVYQKSLSEIKQQLMKISIKSNEKIGKQEIICK